MHPRFSKIKLGNKPVLNEANSAVEITIPLRVASMKQLFSPLLLSSTMFIATSNAQESKSGFDDKNGVSRVNDYTNLLGFVESVRQSVAEVSWYFYFTEMNKSTGKKSIIVTTQDLDYLTDM